MYFIYFKIYHLFIKSHDLILTKIPIYWQQNIRHCGFSAYHLCYCWIFFFKIK